MKYASRINCLEDKSLLNAFEMTETEDMISFSAGFPSGETYPLAHIQESFLAVLAEAGSDALSYCATSGYRQLREIIRDRMERKFRATYGVDEVIITSGSQQGLDMSAMLFVNKGDVVLFEMPSYLGAVNALRAHEATLVGVTTDREGIEIDALHSCLEQYGDRVKMVYVNPDYQNPTGRSWSQERRKAFIRLMRDYDIPIIEDGAYAELSFEHQCAKPLSYYDEKGQVVYIGTFSKTFCPGLRVAWLCARGELMEKYLLLKNASDLSSSTIAQRQMAYYLQRYSLDDHIEKITELYRHRRDLMAEGLKSHFPDDVHFALPEGGLFIWLELPEGKDARELLKLAMKEKVSFIPGTSFYPSGGKHNELRLNFSNMSDEDTMKGMEILGRITTEFLSK